MGAQDRAIAALERRVRHRIRRDLAGLASKALVTLRDAARAAPDATAGELLSRVDVHQALIVQLRHARTGTETAVRAAYRSAATLGHAHARRQLRAQGHAVTGTARTGGDYLESVIGDVTTAYSQTLFGIHNAVRDAWGMVGGSDPHAARTLLLHAELRREVARLYTRVGAAGAAATHRGYSDAESDAWAGFGAGRQLVKTWRVTSDNPCPACLALDGVIVNAGAQFDATTGDRPVAVYADLSVPPRHPYCRCRVVYSET